MLLPPSSSALGYQLVPVFGTKYFRVEVRKGLEARARDSSTTLAHGTHSAIIALTLYMYQ